jgi:CxxC motif-containing protein
MPELICIVCPKGCRLKLDENNAYSVSGQSCPRGEEYGRTELKNPTRVLTSTVRVRNSVHSRCPVKTSAPIPKKLIREAMLSLDSVSLNTPVKVGQVAVRNVCGTDIDFVATRDIP